MGFEIHCHVSNYFSEERMTLTTSDFVLVSPESQFLESITRMIDADFTRCPFHFYLSRNI